MSQAPPPPPDNDQEPEWIDPELEVKKAREAWLQRHWKIVTPLLIAVMLAVFILPLVFLSFLEALVIQIAGAGILYMLGRKFTTAFDKRRIF
ncbi:MAG: hypothetical protein K9K65_15065 [Desulfarculaceae bacterium]|nr:hypothetical protein [Desulfarculaceae bacterium]MCF8048773.1 hypothetical protein [Desulfarculaceae bacterium]MCF8065207.1 hypothetical protein [Desulfarculaceae bacterium]MCF8099158.1 hypothetical protein [Desulfarculaceae bacterium]MCF8121997.1 hypothetical protein [Desulfarculaceae bacterium]